jgi:hypothetical protein
MNRMTTLEYAAIGSLTVCVGGGGASVDSVWEQEKRKAGKMLANAAESHQSAARFVRPLLLTENPC